MQGINFHPSSFLLHPLVPPPKSGAMIQTLTLRTVVCQGLRSEKPSISPKNGCWKFFQPDFLPNFSVTCWNDWFLKNHPSLFCFSNDFNRLVKIGQSGWRWMVFRNFWQFCVKNSRLIQETGFDESLFKMYQQEVGKRTGWWGSFFGADMESAPTVTALTNNH